MVCVCVCLCVCVCVCWEVASSKPVALSTVLATLKAKQAEAGHLLRQATDWLWRHLPCSWQRTFSCAGTCLALCVRSSGVGTSARAGVSEGNWRACCKIASVSSGEPFADGPRRGSLLKLPRHINPKPVSVLQKGFQLDFHENVSSFT